MGGETALRAVVEHNLAAEFFKERFRAAIAYYPYCDIDWPKTATRAGSTKSSCDK